MQWAPTFEKVKGRIPHFDNNTTLHLLKTNLLAHITIKKHFKDKHKTDSPIIDSIFHEESKDEAS